MADSYFLVNENMLGLRKAKASSSLVKAKRKKKKAKTHET